MIKELSQYLYSLDPYQLASAGCPADEYHIEAQALIEQYPDLKSITIKQIQDLFEEFFGHIPLSAEHASDIKNWIINNL